MNTLKNSDRHSITGRLGFIWLALILAALSPSAHAAQSVSLAWDPSPGTNATGYILHYGQVSGSSTNTVDVGRPTTNIVSGLQDGKTYFFFVTAYNALRVESVPSNLINYTVPGTITTPNVSLSSILLNPGGFVTLTWPSVPGKTYRVVYKTKLTDPGWTTLSPDVVSAGTIGFQSDYVVGNRFYGVVQLP